MIRLAEMVAASTHRYEGKPKGQSSITVVVPPELHERLRSACNQTAIPISRVVRAALDRLLDEAETAEGGQ